MSASYQRYTVAFYLEGFNGRQLATTTTAGKQQELINFMEDNGGVLDGQWHKFSTEQNFHLAITKTRALGGIVYDLPVKTGI